MLDPELPEERQTEIVTRARELIEKDGGRVDAHEPWGRRRLAYEIDHKTEGTYHLLTFASEPATLDEISRVLKITDGVMRHLAVRRVEGSHGPAARADARRAGSGGGRGDGGIAATARASDRQHSASARSQEEEEQWPTSTASSSSGT